MTHPTKRSLLLPFFLIAVFGTVEARVLDPGHQRLRIERPTGRTNPLLTRAATLIPQSGEGDDIRSAFNENVDRVRLMVLLAPT